MNENHSEIDRLKRRNRYLTILSASLAISLLISTIASYYILNAKNKEYETYRAYVNSTNQRINKIQAEFTLLEERINTINSTNTE